MPEVKGYANKLGNNKYRLRASYGNKSSGRPNWIGSTNVTAKNDREAYRKLDEWLEQFEGITNETIDLIDITFEDFYKKIWSQQTPKELNLEPKTYHNYKRHLELRFLAPLGLLRLSDIKPYQIKKIILGAQRIDQKGLPIKDGKPLSRATRKQYLFALNNLMLLAKNEYNIIKDNPCDYVTIPRELGAKKNVEEPYSEKEIEAFLKAAMQEELSIRTLMLTAFVTGAREGELAALEESDVNVPESYLRFHKRLSEVTSKEVVLRQGLKNGDEEKIIPIPAFLLIDIQELIKRNKEIRLKLSIDKPNHRFIFDNVQDGETLPRPSYLYKRFKRFTQRNGLRHIRFHDIRHTSATFWLNDPNMSVTEVQHRLGHRSQSTTTNIYGHVLRKKQDRVSEMMTDLTNRISD